MHGYRSLNEVVLYEGAPFGYSTKRLMLFLNIEKYNEFMPLRNVLFRETNPLNTAMGDASEVYLTLSCYIPLGLGRMHILFCMCMRPRPQELISPQDTWVNKTS